MEEGGAHLVLELLFRKRSNVLTPSTLGEAIVLEATLNLTKFFNI